MEKQVPLKEVSMSGVSIVKSRSRPSRVMALMIIGSGLVVHGEDGSPGPLAQSCGIPSAPAAGKTGGRGGPPTFPPGQYPVTLPLASMLGARNDLPNPYRPGVSWGQLPEGRKWGSTASVSTAPDGTIWVVDRCGNSGAGGTTC